MREASGSEQLDGEIEIEREGGEFNQGGEWQMVYASEG